MKHPFLILLIILFINSCKHNKNKKNQQIIKKSNKLESNKIKNPPKNLIKNGDTIIVKQVHKIEDYDSFSIRSFSYLWITKKDTLDFKIHAREYLRDSAKTQFHIDIRHSETIFFSTALERLKKCMTIIQKDFTLKSLGSLQFEGTYAYKDFRTTLPKEYERKYGTEKINSLELNNFLMESSMNIELKKFLFSLKKDTYVYSIEKFQVRDSIITGIAILVRIKNDE